MIFLLNKFEKKCITIVWVYFCWTQVRFCVFYIIWPLHFSFVNVHCTSVMRKVLISPEQNMAMWILQSAIWGCSGVSGILWRGRGTGLTSMQISVGNLAAGKLVTSPQHNLFLTLLWTISGCRKILNGIRSLQKHTCMYTSWQPASD